MENSTTKENLNPTTTSTTTTSSIAMESDRMNFIRVADFNNDNRSDVFLIHGSNLLILLNNGDETFQSPTVLSNNQIIMIETVYIGDFNNDNQSDVLLTRSVRSKENLMVLLGNGNGAFYPQVIMSCLIRLIL
ncbi:unnamed protein product [Adineta ricciae]|uniref:Uncharacterized protein n=1 Tax=Adineta ricciae TaxID=249248 RepID=A0A816BSI8_ADIRI|nr:unnamed protein product [Adineta ricciae]CAF1613331.1 unnamed protein product [Adineta ricciae]